MNKRLRDAGLELIRKIIPTYIIGKKMKGISKKLYYERSQHLVFFLQKEIEYERNIQKKIKSYINNGDIVFDIGGNIGQYALFFSDAVGEQGRVYSFEPDFKNFSFLQFNNNINRCGNLQCFNNGLGELDGELEFFRDAKTGGRKGSFIKHLVGKNYDGYKDVVRLRKFDTVIKELGEPDFVKMDVEGFEGNVLKGLSIDLSNTKFLVEVRKETKNIVYEYFSNRKYKCIWIDNIDLEIKNVDGLPRVANLLFLK